MKKGFTLMELIAVIIILAIIALIAIPIVNNVVESSRKDASKISARNYLTAVNNSLSLSDLKEDDIISDGVYTVTELRSKGVTVTGTYPTDLSTVEVLNGEINGCELKINGYSFICDGEDFEIIKLEDESPEVNVSVDLKDALVTLSDNQSLVGYYVSSEEVEPTEWNVLNRVKSYEFTYTATEAGIYYAYAKDYSGNITYESFEIDQSAFCAYKEGDVFTYSYTGSVQSFTVPCSGTYKLEAYGSQGGSSGGTGGKGGYTAGQKSFTKDEILYLQVGGTNGYNGGGSGSYSTHQDACSYRTHSRTNSSGGGATSIATATGLLSSLSSNKSAILLVSGGGGGGSYNYEPEEHICCSDTPGNSCDQGDIIYSLTGGAGGSSASGSFGQGSSYGGGGGYNGGAATSGTTSAKGGSNYVSSVLTDTTNKAGINSGNGSIKITLIEIDK